MFVTQSCKNAPVSLVLSSVLFACNNMRSDEWILMKFDIKVLKSADTLTCWLKSGNNYAHFT